MPDLATSGQALLAAEIKGVRKEGMTWVSIARVKGLPNPSAARSLVRKTYGRVPRVQAVVGEFVADEGFDWLDRVACKDRTAFFFSEDEDDQAEAERICLTECPVLAQCQQWRKATRPSAGVWAGRVYARA